MTSTPAMSLLDARPGSDPATLPQLDELPTSVRLSRRELSLIVERLLMWSGCPKGTWPGARDYVLETIAVRGRAALRDFESALAADTSAEPWRPGVMETPDRLRFAGEPLLLRGNEVVNALIARLADEGSTMFSVVGLGATAGHEGLRVRAAYFGFDLHVHADDAAGSLDVVATPIARDPDSDLVRLLRRGVEVDGAQWWRLYQPSNFALSEENEVSRSHTGVSETLLHYTS